MPIPTYNQLHDKVERAVSDAFERSAPDVEISDADWCEMVESITKAVRSGRRKIKVDVPGRLREDTS